MRKEGTRVKSQLSSSQMEVEEEDKSSECHANDMGTLIGSERELA
jgi:hypothetical protein